MNEPINQPASDFRLTPEEREGMRLQMRAFVDAHPVRIRVPVFARFARIGIPVLAAVLIFAGPALAADQSLPDDFLYPVKTEVLEPLLFESLAFTDSSEARASNQLLERRIDEAQTLLAGRKRISPKASTTLRRQIGEHAGRSQEIIRAIAGNGASQEAFSLGSELEAILEAHTDAIDTLDGHDAQADAESLIDAIADERDETATLSDALEDQVVADDAAENDIYAEETRDAAATEIEQLREALAGADASGELVQAAARQLREAESAYAAALTRIAAEDHDAAATGMQEALHAAQQGRILVMSQESIQEAAEEDL